LAPEPVDLLVVPFPGNHFKGEIPPALTDLIESGAIRVIDILCYSKSTASTSRCPIPASGT
jgi:hypothetical protein